MSRDLHAATCTIVWQYGKAIVLTPDDGYGAVYKSVAVNGATYQYLYDAHPAAKGRRGRGRVLPHRHLIHPPKEPPPRLWGGSRSPGTPSAAMYLQNQYVELAALKQPARTASQRVKMRVNYAQVNTPGTTVSATDRTWVEAGGAKVAPVFSATFQYYYAGPMMAVTTNWFDAPSGGQASVRWASGSSVPASRYSGATVRSYEYRRYEAGATPTWLPLRFPGQYADQETGLFENWNRFYDPATGRYSASDPVLAGGGLADLLANRPYAYAANSPLSSYDADGRKISTDGLSAEQAERVWRHTVAASRDQIIGAKVKSLIADPRTILITMNREEDGASTFPLTPSEEGGGPVTGAMINLGTPGNSPEGYGNSDYTNLIHEYGHTYDFFRPGVELAPNNDIVAGSSDAANDREAVLWENRARLAKPHASPTVFEQGKPQCSRDDICRSNLRRVHWNPDGSYRLVFP